MTKTERLMLLEIYTYSNIVPDIRNNMDFEGYGAHRIDTIEVNGYLHDMSYALLMYGSPDEEKSYWKEKFYELLEELKEYVKDREAEQWGQSKIPRKYFHIGLC